MQEYQVTAVAIPQTTKKKTEVSEQQFVMAGQTRSRFKLLPMECKVMSFGMIALDVGKKMLPEISVKKYGKLSDDGVELGWIDVKNLTCDVYVKPRKLA